MGDNAWCGFTQDEANCAKKEKKSAGRPRFPRLIFFSASSSLEVPRLGLNLIAILARQQLLDWTPFAWRDAYSSSGVTEASTLIPVNCAHSTSEEEQLQPLCRLSPGLKLFVPLFPSFFFPPKRHGKFCGDVLGWVESFLHWCYVSGAIIISENKTRDLFLIQVSQYKVQAVRRDAAAYTFHRTVSLFCFLSAFGCFELITK